MNNTIYIIKNNISNKYYIGRTNSFSIRKSNHFGLLRRNIHPNIKLQNSYNKYGKDCFVVDILEKELSFEDCLNREEYYIDEFDSVKNGYNIEEGGNRERVAMGNVRYWKGKKGGDHNCSKETFQYDLDGKFIRKWNSVIDAANFYNVSSSMISYCCTGKYFISSNFYWTHEFKGDLIEIKRHIPHNVKSVNMIKIETDEIVNTFPNIQSAYKFFGKEKGKISEVCKGKRNIWNGYSWRYN